MAKLVIGTDKTVVVPAVVKEIEKQEPYPLLSRVKDDNNTDIGCVVGYHTDANNQKYAVVCLNKEYRPLYSVPLMQHQPQEGGEIIGITDVTFYDTISAWVAPETATYNCDKIIENYTSGQCCAIDCRNLSFVIDGVTYKGQVPTISELLCIMLVWTTINSNDPSVSGPEISTGTAYFASTPYSAKNVSYVTTKGNVANILRSSQSTTVRPLVLPVLEIPIN